jgi:hypothetical protein
MRLLQQRQEKPNALDRQQVGAELGRPARMRDRRRATMS